MSGKGDKQRPTDKKTFDKNFEKIFGNQNNKIKKKEIKNESKINQTRRPFVSTDGC